MVPELASWMRRLLPVHPAAAAPEWTAARSEVRQLLGPGPEGWLAGLAQVSAELVSRREPGFALTVDRLVPWLAWLDARMLLALCGVRQAVLVDGLDEEFVTELVHRGIRFDQTLRMIHLHQGQFTLTLYNALRTVAPIAEQVDTMAAVEQALYQLLDEFTVALHKAYSDSLEAWTATGEAARAALVRKVMNGTVHPGEIERRTGYRLDANHVALVAFSPTSEPKKLTVAALGILRAVGARSTLHALLAPNLLWAWGTIDAATTAVSHPVGGCSGCTVALGMPGVGISGFLDSHREAEAVHSLDSLVEWHNLGRSFAYDDLGMVAEMAARPQRLKRFIAGHLGPLAHEGAYAAELRTTLLAYLETNRSLTEAAGRLHVAKNTVAYRLRRAEETLGHSLVGDQAALQCALLAIDLLGPGFIADPQGHPTAQHQMSPAPEGVA